MSKISLEKKEIRAFSATDNQIINLADMVLQGHVNPLEVIAFLKKIRVAAENASDLIKDATVEGLSKYSSAEQTAGVSIDGCNIAARSSGGQYVHVDPLIIEAKARLKALEDLSKDAYKGKIAIDKETGQIIEAAKFNPGKVSPVITILK